MNKPTKIAERIFNKLGTEDSNLVLDMLRITEVFGIFKGLVIGFLTGVIFFY
jgi:hypothetical protein